MADALTLDVKTRTAAGKANKKLRRQGWVPVHLFGEGIDSQGLQAEERALRHVVRSAGMTALIRLNVEGTDENVMVRHVQRHPITGSLIHVDLYRVRMDHKIRTRVPLAFTGEAPGVSLHDGVLLHQLEAVNVEALPAALPRHIEVDISGLAEIDAVLYVRDLQLPSGVVVLDDPDDLLVKVQPPQKTGEEAVVSEPGAAPAAEAAAGEAPAAQGEQAAE